MEKLNKLKNVMKKGVKLGAAITLGTMLMGCPNPNGPQNPDYPGNPGIEKPEPGKEQVKYGIPSNKVLGNGNYTIHSFVGENEFTLRSAHIAKDVNHYLGKGETYVKGLVNQFSDSLKGRPAAEAYFAQFISEEQNNEFKRLNENGSNPYSFDTTIKGIAKPSHYIFENIIRNIDNNRDRHFFRLLYQTLETVDYGYALANYKNVPSSQKDKYEKNREIVNDGWMTALINNPFDLNQDIDQQNCQQVTNEMDAILARVVTSMGNDVTVRDLQQVINIALTANSLAAMHDLSTSALKHTSCDAQIGIVGKMEDVAREMYQAERQQAQGMTK